MQRITIIVTLCLIPASLCAQWSHVKTPGIPRNADGKLNLSAPAPRTSDGKPDLSGLWRSAPNFYWLDLIRGIEDEAIFRPEAQAVFRKRATEYNVDGPYTRCLPLGPGDIFLSSYQIMQSPTEVAMLRNTAAGDDYRQIFMDGRELPKDPNPTWRGYSVGHWDGDTLVVETVGFNDIGSLDQVGHPRSEKLHVTEKFRRVDFGHLRVQMTLEDPDTLAKPFTIPLEMTYAADTAMDEVVCNENERDRAHFATGKLTAKIQLSAAALTKYAGTYEPGDIKISLVNDQLYIWDLPLFPQSETVFESRLAPIQFSLDANGAVTSVEIVGAVGDQFKLVRKR